MTLRVYIGSRLGDGNETPFYSETERWALLNLGLRTDGVRQLISPCLAVTVDVLDTTNAQNNQITNAVQCVEVLDSQLNNAWGSFGAGVQNAIVTRLNALGFDTSWIVPTNTMREVLNYVYDSVQLSEKCSVVAGALMLGGDFNAASRLFGDLTAGQKTAVLNMLAQHGISANGTDATPLSEIAGLLKVRGRIKGL